MEMSDQVENGRLAVPDETSPLLAFPGPATRSRRCSSLGSRDDAPEPDIVDVESEEKPLTPRQLWLSRIKITLLSIVVLFAVVSRLRTEPGRASAGEILSEYTGDKAKQVKIRQRE